MKKPKILIPNPSKKKYDFSDVPEEAYTNCAKFGREIVYAQGSPEPELCEDLNGFFGCKKTNRT